MGHSVPDIMIGQGRNGTTGAFFSFVFNPLATFVGVVCF
jgi:hypothetical protein